MKASEKLAIRQTVRKVSEKLNDQDLWWARYNLWRDRQECSPEETPNYYQGLEVTDYFIATLTKELKRRKYYDA